MSLSYRQKRRAHQTLCEIPTTEGVNWCLHFLMHFSSVQWTQFKFFYKEPLISQKLWPEMVLKWKSVKFFFFFFFLYVNRCLTIECLLKKCITEELLCGSFLRTTIVNRGNSCKFKPRKIILVLRQWADLYSFSRVF